MSNVFQRMWWRSMVWVVVTIVTTVVWRLFYTNQWVWTDQKVYGDGNVQIANSPNVVVNYSDTKDPNYINKRSDFLIWKTPVELTKLFFELQNQNRYRDACSLLVKRKWSVGCSSADGDNVSDFSRQVKKFTNWYENVVVLPLSEWEYDQTICVKYSYTLKSDTDPAQIREYYGYDREKREDNEWELASRVCEEITKIGKWQIGCPIQTNKKRCYDLLK